jgi:hypothetical protein
MLSGFVVVVVRFPAKLLMSRWLPLHCLKTGLFLLAGLGGCATADAVTVVLDSVADTSLYQAHPDANLGATTLVAGINNQNSDSRALIQFDLSSIPAGSVITSVLVTLTVTRQPDPDQHLGPQNSDFSLYTVLRPWGEGTGSNVTGSLANTGDATWNAAQYGVPNGAWTAPGGQIGSDFATNPSATSSVAGLGSYIWGSSDQLVSDAQSWLDDPTSNYGWVLIDNSQVLPNPEGTARRFSSKEESGGGIPPPELTITYTSTPEPGMTFLVGLGTVLCVMRRRRDVPGRCLP